MNDAIKTSGEPGKMNSDSYPKDGEYKYTRKSAKFFVHVHTGAWGMADTIEEAKQAASLNAGEPFTGYQSNHPVHWYCDYVSVKWATDLPEDIEIDVSVVERNLPKGGEA